MANKFGLSILTKASISWVLVPNPFVSHGLLITLCQTWSNVRHLPCEDRFYAFFFCLQFISLFLLPFCIFFFFFSFFFLCPFLSCVRCGMIRGVNMCALVCVCIVCVCARVGARLILTDEVLLERICNTAFCPLLQLEIW